MRAEVDDQKWDDKAKLPHGLAAIQDHLKNVDDVPLLVSLFTDCEPPRIAGMVRIMQEYGEQVMMISSALKDSTSLLLAIGDVGMAVSPAPSMLEQGMGGGGRGGGAAMGCKGG